MPSHRHASLSAWIKQCAREIGFYSVGVLPASFLFEEDASLERWNQRGYSGTMSYMKAFRNRLERFKSTFPAAKSIIVLTVSYYHSNGSSSGPTSGSMAELTGRVARYARGRDYHKILRKKLKLLSQRIRQEAGGAVEIRYFVDTGPILEKKLAARSGLGFIGKNTSLVTPAGSYFFLAELVTDLELAYDGPGRAFDGCGQCTLCIEACPTEAIRDPFTIDARRCISYLTIEHRGAIERRLQPSMEDWLFGCDICIDVCPFNGTPIETPWEELKHSGVGEAVPLGPILALSDNETFRRRFQGTPLLRAKREGLTRNASIVLENLRRKKDQVP